MFALFNRPNSPASPLGASLPNAPGPQRGREQPELFPMNASARALITARGTMREDAAARGMRGERWQLAMEPRERLPGGPAGTQALLWALRVRSLTTLRVQSSQQLWEAAFGKGKTSSSGSQTVARLVAGGFRPLPRCLLCDEANYRPLRVSVSSSVKCKC